MFTLRQHIRNGSIGVWHGLFCLAVLSFVCRAMIPVGYMPDLSGTSNSTFSVTLCTVSGGTSTLLLDLDAHSDHSSSNDHFDHQDCPFGIVMSQVAMPSQAPPALAGNIAHRPVFLSHRNQAHPPLPALGPPLGSRAPPSNLG